MGELGPHGRTPLGNLRYDGQKSGSRVQRQDQRRRILERFKAKSRMDENECGTLAVAGTREPGQGQTVGRSNDRQEVGREVGSVGKVGSFASSCLEITIDSILRERGACADAPAKCS